MAQNVTLWGASYSDVPAVDVPKTGGGTARFADPSITTAVESDVAQGKTFLKADGSTGTGTATGGGGTVVITDTQDAAGGIVRTITAGVVMVDGDNFGYGYAVVGTAIVGEAIVG